MIKIKQLPFWVFTISAFCALLLPALVKNGMFLDGLLNASIARNLSQGVGGFWSLEYSSALCNPFYDQLPLAFWLQSLFFRLFGDHLYVERLYSLLTALATAYFIIRLWRLIVPKNSASASMGWLPVLLWISTPVVFWSYANNMLDNTMAVFDCAALFLIIKALSSGKLIFLRLAVAGALILGAFLSKGPIGLFPLASIFIYGLCYNTIRTSRIFLYTALIIAVPAVLLVVMLLTMDNAQYSFSEYFGQQIVQSIAGQRDQGISRWYIVGRLCLELLPMLILSSLAFLLSKIRRVKPAPPPDHIKSSAFFLILALSGSLPIMISQKQSGYYLLPSLPLFAIAAAMLIAPRLVALIQKINTKEDGYKFAIILTSIILCATLVFSVRQTGKINRDHTLIYDITLMGQHLPHHTSVSVCPSMMDDWGLHAYMMRYYAIKLDYRKQYKFYITNKNCSGMVPENYLKIPMPTQQYDLYFTK